MRKNMRGRTGPLDCARSLSEIDCTFPPLMAMTAVLTKKENLGLRGKLSLKMWRARQWRVRGLVTGFHNADDSWQEVMHPDGSLGYFHQTELQLWHEPPCLVAGDTWSADRDNVDDEDDEDPPEFWQL